MIHHDTSFCKFCLLSSLKRKLDFDIESWLFRWSPTVFPVLPLARLTWAVSLFEAASYPPSKTIVGQLPFRFFMYFTYAWHICANVWSTVSGTLCKSEPPSRTYLLLGSIITCTVSGNYFDKLCSNFGASASFIRSSLSNNDIGLVLNLYPNAVDNSSKRYTAINLWNSKAESTWIFSPSVDSDDFVFMGTTMSLHLKEKLKTN